MSEIDNYILKNGLMHLFHIYFLAQCSAVGDTNIIRLNGSVLKEVFEIDEEKIRDGLTSENTGNASLIQLFYLVS